MNNVKPEYLKLTDNPGSFRPYKQKNIYSLLLSLFNMVKKENYEQGFRYLITEGFNFVNRIKNKNKLGKSLCPICKQSNVHFIHISNQIQFAFNSICPNCSSRSRHRGLYFLYDAVFKKNKNHVKILHFAPEVVFMKFFEDNSFITYHTADLSLQDVDYPKLDIQKIDIPDRTYDYILCNHVLEHVKNDKIAIREIKRCLKPNGQAIITVPGDFKKLNTQSFYHKLPNGHYREYGYDFIKVLEKYFDCVRFIDLHRYDLDKRYGIRKNEFAFIATKS